MSSAPSISEQTIVVSPSGRNSTDTGRAAQLFDQEDVEKALRKEPINLERRREDTVDETGEEELGTVVAETLSSTKSPRKVHGWRWILVCASLYINAFTYGLDTTIAADVQGAVAEAFGDVQEISWLGAGFMMGSVATILPLGNLYDRFNAKWLFVSGMILFELGSVVCGAAPSMNALIVGRVIAGIGGSGIYMGALNYFTELTTDEERGLYINMLGIFWGAGAVAGPLIGGAFVISAATWRWAFYINLIIAAVCAPIILCFLPSMSPLKGASIISRLATIDWVGAVLNAAMWGLFTVVLTFAGSIWAWSDGRTIALWVVFGVVLVSFLAQQGFAVFTSKARRIFPAHLLKSRTQVLLYIATGATATALFVPIYYLPLYFQFVHGDSAILAAVRLLPYIAVSMSVNFLFGLLLPKIPYYAALYLGTGLFVTSGGAVLYTVNPDTPIANVYGFSVLVAIGAGATVQTGYTLASLDVEKKGRDEDVTNTVAFQNVAQIGSGAIALVLAGQVFQSYSFRNLSTVLAGSGFSAEDIRAAVAGTQSVVFDSIDADKARLATAAITSAMSNVYILVIVAGAVSIVTSLLMRWERLYK